MLARPAALGAAVLAVAVLALYGPALGYGFVYDDVSLIETNAALADWGTLGEALTHDLFHFAEGTRSSPYWRPLVSLSYYIDHALGGGRAAAFHATNLALLWACGLALVAVLRRSGVGVLGAWALALLFVAHPLQVEGAANAAGRTDLLATALGLGALAGTRPGRSAGLTLLACLAKEIAVLIPLVAWLRDPRDRTWRWQAGAVALFVVARVAVLAQLDLAAEDAGGGTAASWLGAGGRVLFWLGRLVWPLPMGPAAELAPAEGTLAAAGWVTLAAFAALGWRASGQQRAAAALTLLPLLMVSGLLQAEPRYGDSLTVLPWAGAVWLLGPELVAGGRGRQLAPVLLALVLAVPSVQRLPEWSSSRTLWEAAHQRDPDDRVVALGLARVLSADHPRQALAVLDPAVWPRGSRQRREAAAVVARAHLALGEQDAALAWLSQAVHDEPESAWANAKACVLLAARGSRAARQVCELAVRTTPDDPDVCNARGIAAIPSEGPAGALPWFTRAAELAPDRPEFTANRDRAREALSGP